VLTDNIETLDDFLKCCSQHQGKIFRGVSNKGYQLVPAIGRDSNRKAGSHGPSQEQEALRRFKNLSWPHVSRDLTEIQWLALGQHHGLWTRLLDWSTSPLVALYFAVVNMGYENHDGAVYIASKPQALDLDSNTSVFDLKEVRYFQAPAVSSRIPAQSGVFTIHPEPDKSWEPENLVQLVIPAAKCGDVKTDLSKIGISEAALFPDIDGQARSVNWLFKWGDL